jgi:glucan-binding YG repeat protein
MKIKKMISTFCLAASLAIAVPTLSSTFGIADTLSTVSAADGWQQDDSGWYYLQGDTKLTGRQTISGSTYYFDANGYRVTGPVKIDGTTWYFSPETGKLSTGTSGLVQSTADTDVYYFFSSSKNGSIATSKWVKSKGGYYYADADGQIKLGTIKVGSKLYHITAKGRLTSYTKSSYDQKYYYATAKGVLKTGLQKISGKYYYFNPKTGMRQTGAVTIKGYTYFFNTKTGAARTGWVKSGGKYYYYDKSYHQVTGFLTISKKRYYFDASDNGARVQSSWKKIGKYYYYFNAKGVIQTGFFKVGDDTYYATAKGIRKRGWQTVSGRKYYLDKTTGIVQTGWLTYNNKKYYLNPTKSSSTYGAAKTGFVKIDGSWYYFNNDGTMRTGWLISDGKYYYFNKTTGKMLTGTQTIGGKTYDFGKSGAYTKKLTGEWRIEVNRKKCFVVVYRGSTAIKAFVCSTAKDGVSTPTGTFKILDKLRWHELNGPTWGQYCSHITSDILFHSVPNSKYNDNHSLKAAAYNMLGSPASAGCIRLTVGHAKWLYDNVPIGTKVVISDSVATPKYVTIEQAEKIPLTQNYDPTDPDA